MATYFCHQLHKKCTSCSASVANKQQSLTKNQQSLRLLFLFGLMNKTFYSMLCFFDAVKVSPSYFSYVFCMQATQVLSMF